MQQKEKEGIKWLQFDLFSDIKRIVHGVFLRYGGVSSGNFYSLNCSKSVGDSAENVDKNLFLVKQSLQIEELALAKQVHGVDSFEINRMNASRQLPVECDALLTSSLNIGIAVTHADCQAALFYDPIHHVAAAVHCGWHGSVQNIYKKTIASLKKKYGSQPQELLVGISPSLGPEAAEFVNYRQELPNTFWPYQIKENYFDFWAISKQQLCDEGLLAHHIEIAPISTYSNPDYFSYRRNKTTGRHITLIALKSEIRK